MSTTSEIPRTFRVHFSQQRFSSVEVGCTDQADVIGIATRHWELGHRLHFNCVPVAFRVEVLRRPKEGEPYWEEIDDPGTLRWQQKP